MLQLYRPLVYSMPSPPGRGLPSIQTDHGLPGSFRPPGTTEADNRQKFRQQDPKESPSK